MSFSCIEANALKVLMILRYDEVEGSIKVVTAP